MIRQEINNLIKESIRGANLDGADFSLEHPEDKIHGDYATNVALRVARTLKMPPAKIAENLKPRFLHLRPDLFERIEFAEPGFINFFVSPAYLQKQVGEILEQKEEFGQLKIGKGKKVNIEFISANPTGPLHIGNARGGYCGDVLANVLEKAGYIVWREYFVNDRGKQIGILQDTLEGKDGYKNEYTDKLIEIGEKDVRKAVKFIADKIKQTTERMGIHFDKWFYETELHEKEVRKVLDFLKKKSLSYEKDGALWFKSTEFGDDKDRVLIRAQEKTTYEEETYLLSDIAYLNNKFKRGFDYLIIFLGAEHHGYIPRLKAAVSVLGYNKDRLAPIIFQLVRLIKDGQEVRMSKRGGVFVAIEDLLDEISNDVSRFFFLARSYGNHLDFDVDLAKEQSEKNPVYYVQYAHARICSILEKSKAQNPNPASGRAKSPNLELLNHSSELNLIKELIAFPEVIEDTACDYQVQRLPQYAVSLATAFHQFYQDCQVLSENNGLTQARLSLVLAVKIVLKNTLLLMGISAPEKM